MLLRTEVGFIAYWKSYNLERGHKSEITTEQFFVSWGNLHMEPPSVSFPVDIASHPRRVFGEESMNWT